MLNLEKYNSQYLDVWKTKLLEIGAYDRPTFTKQESEIYFADAQSKNELIVDAPQNGRKIDSIVDMDYILRSNEY